MTHLEQVLDPVRRRFEAEWTPFRDDEWADLRAMAAAAVEGTYTLKVREGPLVPVTLGLAIKLAREAARMNQLDLAGLIGVSTSTVCYWETERQHPNEDNLKNLRDVLGKTIPLGSDVDS